MSDALAEPAAEFLPRSKDPLRMAQRDPANPNASLNSSPNGTPKTTSSTTPLTRSKQPPDSKSRLAGPGSARPYDLLAVDIDGTLLRSDKKLTVRNARAIRQANEAGVKVVLASARPPRSVREIYAHLQLDTWQINYNGALIFDQMTSRCVHHQPLDAALVKRMVKAARRADPKVIVSIEILDKWYTDHFDPDVAYRFPTETSKRFNPDFVGPLTSFLHVPVTKLMLLAPPDRLGRIRTALTRKFAGRMALAVSDPYLLQVIHPQVDKARALAQVCQHYSIDQSRVMAIGDAPNDAGMLRWAGLGAVVGNGWDAARRAADTTLPANDADAVAHAIDRFILHP